jgi:hypothetical protein
MHRHLHAASHNPCLTSCALGCRPAPAVLLTAAGPSASIATGPGSVTGGAPTRASTSAAPSLAICIQQGLAKDQEAGQPRHGPSSEQRSIATDAHASGHATRRCSASHKVLARAI